MNLVAVLEHLPLGHIRENSREGRVRKHPGSTITRKGYSAFLSGPLCNRTCLLVSESTLPQETTELGLYWLISYHFLICSAGESTGEWIPLYIRIDLHTVSIQQVRWSMMRNLHIYKLSSIFFIDISIYIEMNNRQALMTYLHVIITYRRVPVCKHSKIYVHLSLIHINTCRKSLYLDTA